jgi:trimeric autotransporter adhesin
MMEILPMRIRFTATVCLVFVIATAGLYSANGQEAEQALPTPSRITQPIDELDTVPLKGHVLRSLTPERDLGAVEDSRPVRLYLTLQRTPAQQADLDSLLAAQQNPKSAQYHKWLTPEQFGARFGASDDDIQQINRWLESKGFQVTGAPKNKSVVNFMATAGGVRSAFNAQLHTWNIEGGEYMATATEPRIPAALSNMVAGIAGLNNLPLHTPYADPPRAI